jgi:hypothetical protein
MPELSYNDIERINRDIRKEDITFSHLLDELIDHVCCDVEYEMSNGLSFMEAYNRVRQKIGPRRFKEIQEETLYAIDAKYRKMKTTMKISGIAGTVMFGLAALFKIQHWPLAGALMTLGGFTLAFFFMPSALGVLWKETKSTKKLFLFFTAFLTGFCFITGTLFKVQHWPFAGFILMLGGLSGMLFFIPALLVNRLNDEDNKAKRPVYFIGAAGSMMFIAGFLFKIQHWPMATLLMVTSIILLCIIAFPWYTWITWKEEKHINPMFIYLVIGSLLVIMPSSLVNLDLQHSYQEYYYPNNIQQNELFDYLYSKNSSIVTRFRDSADYPKIEQLHTRTIGIILLINNIQEEMVRESEVESGRPASVNGQIRKTDTGIEIDYKKLSRALDPGPARNFLFPGCSARKELETAVKDYINFLGGFIPAAGLEEYKKMLNPVSFLPTGETEEGITTLLSGLHSLQIIKNGLLTVESSLLNGIINYNRSL